MNLGESSEELAVSWPCGPKVILPSGARVLM